MKLTKPYPLTLVLQRTEEDCVLACAATILNLPYETVAIACEDMFDAVRPLNIEEEFQLYKELGFTSFQPLYTEHSNEFYWIAGKTYLATVPSLNNIYNSHRIIIQVEEVEEISKGKCKVNILDPSPDSILPTLDILQTPITIFSITEVCYKGYIDWA